MQDTSGIEEELQERLSEIVNKDLSKRQVEKIVDLFAPDKGDTITDEELQKLVVNFLKDNPNAGTSFSFCQGYKANPLHRVVDEHFEHNLFMMNADVWTNEHDWTMTIDKFKKCLSEYA